MDIIDRNFSHEEQLRFHNVTIGKMTNKEFDYWYHYVCLSVSNEKEYSAISYYDKRSFMEEIEWWKDDSFVKSSVMDWSISGRKAHYGGLFFVV